MLKKLLPVTCLPLLLVGCTTTITNLTPHQQVRNSNNLYPVEVALSSRQQSLQWDSIQPKIVVGDETYPMHRTQLMTNRWEGFVPIPKDKGWVYYRYRFDYNTMAVGHLKADNTVSKEYPLRIVDK